MTDALPSARPDYQPAPGRSGPTPSMLAYAFGERIAPPAGRLGGKTIPCSGRQVDGDELAITMVHVALWDLERRGRVSLEAPPGEADDGPHEVRPALRALLDDELRNSLEYDLFKSARSGRDDRTVAEVVRQIYPHDVADPFAEIFQLENVAMIETGLMRVDVEGRVAVGAAPRGERNQLIWVCDRVAQHLVGFTTMAAEWRQYREERGSAWNEVHEAIRMGIESRQARPLDEDAG